MLTNRQYKILTQKRVIISNYINIRGRTKKRQMLSGAVRMTPVTQNLYLHSHMMRYRLSLERLMKATETNRELLPTAVSLEHILLRNCKLSIPIECIMLPHDNLAIDVESYHLCQRISSNDNNRQLVTGDGSCLFNAVSVALFGDEKKATELRARCRTKLARC